jgi:endonuclease G
MAGVFRESDRPRLERRLLAVTSGDLSEGEIGRLTDGDLSLLAELPLTSQQNVRALLKDDLEPQLEKMIGVSLDYVPAAYLDLARLAANSVGRVVGQDRRAVGTGTMVSAGLFLTNNHVTPNETVAAHQIVQFDYELELEGTPRVVSEFALDPAAFFWTSPQSELDATLVALGGRVSGSRRRPDFGYCPLSGADDKHAEGDFVTIVQHPNGDYKQIALRENRVIGRGKAGRTLHYEGDTLPGSSGSPVFNDQFVLVALHHAGGPLNETLLDGEQAVPAESNEGIRISAIVRTLRTFLDSLPPNQRALLAAALDPAAVGPTIEMTASRPMDADELPAAAMPVPQNVIVQPAPQTGQWIFADVTVPLRVGLHAAEIAAPPSGLLSGAQVAGVESNQPPDPNYESRRGYDADFLGAEVPLPKSGSERAHDSRSDGDGLRYLHFSIVPNRERRMPTFTAVNIDGRRLRRINRQTGEVEAAETWYQDPRLQQDEQLDQAVFERQQPRIFDRGHMVRRLDPAWGSAATARRASDDTFHFTNCCPQISAFNQRARLWAGIENYVLDNARTERARVTVFTGPVFGSADPLYRGVAVPRAFWKVIVRVEDGALRATAFLADQGELLDAAVAAGIEGFGELGAVAQFQTTVSHLQSITGVQFPAMLLEEPIGPEGTALLPIARFVDIAW